MKKGTPVVARTTRGNERAGTYAGKVMGLRGEYFIIKPLEKGAQTFKARPSRVTPV